MLHMIMKGTVNCSIIVSKSVKNYSGGRKKNWLMSRICQTSPKIMTPVCSIHEGALFFSMLKYPPECAPAGTVGTFQLISQKPMMAKPYFNYLNKLSRANEFHQNKLILKKVVYEFW